MKLLIDTNVYISYLLTQDASSNSCQVVEAAISSDHLLILPEELIDELVETVARKPALTKRIDPTRLEHFLAILRLTAEISPALDRPYPAMSRDPHDDYLLTHALLSQADVLITGDKDLLVLDPLDALRILTPQAFVDWLNP